MNAKSNASKKTWTDPDDAPELTAQDWRRGQWSQGPVPVSPKQGRDGMRQALRGRPRGSVKDTHKLPTTLRLDEDVLARWRASGKGWQTRAAQVLARHAPRGPVKSG